MILSRIMTGLSSPYLASDPLVGAIRRAFWGFAVSGAVIALVSGLYQLIIGGVGFYMKQGWFHGKLTLVIVLLVLTVILAVQVAATKRAEPIKIGLVRAVHGITGFCLIVIVFLTFLGRN